MATEQAAESGHEPRTLVQTATYNERDNLPGLIHAIFAALPTAHVLVIDDSSPDGTGELADQMAAEDARIHVIHRVGKLGLGSAILTGLRYAVEQNYDFVVNMDADFSHPPDRIPALVEGMAKHDVMIGSRYIPGGKIEGWNFKRHFMSQAINIYTRLILPIKIRDASGGFRCYRVAKLKQLDFDRIRSKGYSFQEEFLFRLHQLGCSMGETPITFVNRTAGDSKIRMGEAFSALWILLAVAIWRD